MTDHVERRKRIVEMYNKEGLLHREIADFFNVSISRVGQILAQEEQREKYRNDPNDHRSRGLEFREANVLRAWVGTPDDMVQWIANGGTERDLMRFPNIGKKSVARIMKAYGMTPTKCEHCGEEIKIGRRAVRSNQRFDGKYCHPWKCDLYSR